jgi:DNA-binding XRE family transcriptional regulator
VAHTIPSGIAANVATLCRGADHVKTEISIDSYYSDSDMQHYDKDANRGAPRKKRPSPLQVKRALGMVGSSLEAWRKLRGLTQAQLASRAGLNRDTIARLEKGEGGVSLENLLLVLRALGLQDVLPQALDPYESDIGRLRADEQLPQRVRPRSLKN